MNSVDIIYNSTLYITSTIVNESGTGAAEYYSYNITTSATQAIYSPIGLLSSHTFSSTGSVFNVAPYGGRATTSGSVSYTGNSGVITDLLSSFNSNWNITIDGFNPTTQITGGTNYIEGSLITVSTTVEVIYDYTNNVISKPNTALLLVSGLFLAYHTKLKKQAQAVRQK